MAPGLVKSPDIMAAVRASCIVTTTFMAFSGVPEMVQIVKNKSVGSKTIVPYCVMLLDNSVGWWFSYVSQDDLGLRFRSLSLVMASIYLAIMTLYSSDRRRSFNMVLSSVALFAAYYAGVISLVPPKAWQDFLGATTTATAVSFAASPLADIGKVLATRDASSIPFMMVAMLTLCAGSWATYGVLLRNVWMILPNVVNALLGAAQVALSVTLPGTTPAGDAGRTAAAPTGRVTRSQDRAATAAAAIAKEASPLAAAGAKDKAKKDEKTTTTNRGHRKKEE